MKEEWIPLIAFALALVIQTVGIGYWAGKVTTAIDGICKRLERLESKVWP